MTSPIAERLRRWPAKEDAHVGVSELMMEAAADLDALRLALAGAEERAETAAQKQFEAQDQGADFVIEALVKALGSPDWHPCDGTEEWEGDVIGTVYNILRAAKVFDPDTDELATDKVTTLEARCAELESVLAPAREAMQLADSVMSFCAGDAYEREATEADRTEFYRLYAIVFPAETPPPPKLNSKQRRDLRKREARSAIAPAPGEGESK